MLSYDTRETDCRKAAVEVLHRIPEDADEQLLPDDADPEAGTGDSSPPARTTSGPRHRRRNSAINPAQHAADVVRDLDERPFYVPSLGRYNRVLFRDMTAARWREYADYRRLRAESYEASASWAEGIISRLAEFASSAAGSCRMT